MLGRLRGLALLCGVITAGAGACPAQAGTVAQSEAQVFGQGLEKCRSSAQGTELYRCIGDAMQQMGRGLQNGNAPGMATTAAAAVSKAGADLAAVRTKPAALAVLARVQAVVRGLAAKTSKGAAEAYGHLSQALMRAQAAIAGGG